LISSGGLRPIFILSIRGILGSRAILFR